MSSAEKRERTRALYKKGQKCVIAHTEADEETGEEKMVYYAALVRHGASH